MSLAPTSKLEILVTSWWQRGEWQLRHVARNLVLDCRCLSDPDHPDLPTCGNRLDTDTELHLQAAVERMVPKLDAIERQSSSWDETWSNFGRVLQAEGRRLRRSCQAMAAGDPATQLVRYIDCRAVYEHWLYRGAPTSKERIRDEIEQVLSHPQRFRDWSSMSPAIQATSLFLAGPGQIVWVTPENPAPHRRTELDGLNPTERALATVRLLGLPYYDGEESRREKVGLIAATCSLDPKDLLVPTVLHALDNPYYFPGYEQEDHGRIASLDDQFRPPWQRDDECSKIHERVLENASLANAQPDLELVGFFED